MLPELETSFLLDFLTRLLRIPSPTGFAEEAIAFTEETLAAFPALNLTRTRKGALLVRQEGKRDDAPRALTAHVDTLGAMVKEIKPNGRLKLTKIGGFAWNTVEGEGCLVHTRGGKKIRGSFLLAKASAHVYGSAVHDTPRDDENMEVRLDEKVAFAEDTRALGVEVGDFVSFDPRVEIVNGFVRSRHLDDKAGVAAIAAALHALHRAGKTPAQTAWPPRPPYLHRQTGPEPNLLAVSRPKSSAPPTSPGTSQNERPGMAL